jgi:hypothetical protein
MSRVSLGHQGRDSVVENIQPAQVEILRIADESLGLIL